MDRELRYMPILNLEIRNRDDTQKMTVAGYAVKFNERSRMLYDEFFENTNLVLGSTKSQTLRIKEDDIGLYFELDLPDTETGRNAYESISRGDVDGVSFGFNVRADSWEYIKEEDIYIRTLLDIDLVEISPTPFPAYETSEVGKRSLEQFKNKSNRQDEAEMLKVKIKLLEI